MNRGVAVGGFLLPAVTALAITAAGCGQWSGSTPGDSGPAREGSAGSTTTAPREPAAESCSAPKGARQRDVDLEDSAEYPWPRPPGRPATVFFETGALPPRYGALVEQGAARWSRGPCVRAVAVARCPVDANCTTVRVEPGRGEDGDTDGESEGVENGDVRIGDSISLYPELLDEESDSGALTTVTHEMGHALGLRHRDEDGVLMNAETDDDSESEPDSIDYANLLVIYGGDGHA